MAAGNVSSNIGVGGGIPTVDTLPSSPDGGDVVRLERPSTIRSPNIGSESLYALWYYDGSESRWRLGSTYGQWWPYETWDSGSIRSDYWDVMSGAKSNLNVDAGNARCELPFTSGDAIECRLNSAKRLDLGLDVYFESSMGTGGQPGSGSYLNMVFVGDLDDGGKRFEDVWRSKLSSSSSVFRREYSKDDSDSGGGKTVISNQSISSGVTYGRAFYVTSWGRNRFREWHEDGTNRADRIDDLPQNSSYTDSEIGFYMKAESPDIASTPWVGYIWVRR